MEEGNDKEKEEEGDKKSEKKRRRKQQKVEGLVRENGRGNCMDMKQRKEESEARSERGKMWIKEGRADERKKHQNKKKEEEERR